MEKEEILAKSRKENDDEGLIEAANRGRKLGYSTFCAIFLFICILNIFTGNTNYAPSAMFFAFVAGESYAKYKFTQEKGYLTAAIITAVASAIFLWNFVVTLR